MRRRSARRLGRLLCAAGVVGVAVLPLAHASASETTVALTPSAEAWYQPDPSCVLPIPCGTGTSDAPPVPSPYPAGSLHIAVSAGTETARSYLGFSFASLYGTPQGATLDLPLDTAATDGSLSPEAAHVLACPAFAPIVAVAGSLSNPPAANCTASAALTYVATPQPHLHGDLTPLAGVLKDSNGIALIPDGSLTQSTDSWHVTFSAHDRADSAKTAPALLTVRLSTPDSPTTDPSTPDTSYPLPVPPVAGIAPIRPVTPIGLPTEVAQPPALAGQPTPAVAGGLDQRPAAVPAARSVHVSNAYSEVWLLPLALLLGLPAIASILMRDLSPRSA